MERGDEELVRLAREGSEEAFLELYKSQAPRVHRILWSVLRDRQLAEDGTQEVFVRAWRKLGEFRGESRFGTWIYRIAVNQGLDMRRKQVLRSWLPLLGGDGPEPQAPPAPEPGELPAWVWKGLTPSQRAIVELRLVQELSTAETAAVMGVSEGTIKTQLHRGLQKLRRFFEEEKRPPGSEPSSG